MVQTGGGKPPPDFKKMPIYTFKSNKGETIERLVPAGTQEVFEDGVCYGRTSAPETFALTGGAREQGVKDKVLKGYYDHECQAGSRWRSGYSKEQVKKVWED